VAVFATHLKLNGLSRSDTLNDSETLVESMYQFRSHGGTMQGEVLLNGHLKARWLHLEGLLDNNMWHIETIIRGNSVLGILRCILVYFCIRVEVLVVGRRS